jgi:hypothetical protein
MCESALYYLLHGYATQIRPVEHDLPGGRAYEAGDRAQECRLAGPVGAEHGDDRALGHAEVDLLQDRCGAVAGDQSADFEDAHAGPPVA